VSDGFTFDQEKHLYRVDGRIVPGHTRVLDLGGLVPYGAIEPDILERKSHVGLEVHTACLFHDESRVFTFDPQIKGYIDAWIDFRRQTGFVPLLREYRDIYQINGLKFGMQIDAIGNFAIPRQRSALEHTETVVEIKTCTTILPHHGIQLAAQAAAVVHPVLQSPFARFLKRKRIVVQLKPDGRWKIHTFEERSDFEAFTSALFLTHWKMQHEYIYREMNHDDT
jgi:hypothetical protein